MIFLDGLRNLVANLGTSRDKAFSADYLFTKMSDVEVWDTYRSSAMARKIVDIPADDAVREWREWHADSEQITGMEAEEKRLGLVQKTRQAMKLARLYGGAAIFIGTGEANPEKPLNPESIRAGGIKYLTVLPRTRITPQELQRDPRRPGYGLPSGYTLGDGVTVHPSRVATLHGTDLLDPDMGEMWGDSALQAVIDNVKASDGVAANILSLIYEAKIDVMKIPDFMSNLAARGAVYEKQILDRAQLAAMGKGINGMLLMDADEEYEQKQITFGGLSDIWDRFMLNLAAAADIPATRLWGRSPAGMNATGEADAGNYHAKIGAIQSGQIETAFGVLDECLIRSALGSRPDDVFYSWRPLGKPSTKERAEVADKLTTAFERIHRMDVLPVEAVGKAVVNAMTEAGVAPGLEGDVAEFYEGEGNDTDAAEISGVTDAAPRSLYIHRKVLNGKEIIRWAKAQGFTTTLPSSDMHVTVAFSRAQVDWMEVGESWQDKVDIAPGGARIMEKFGDARVLLFSSDDLKWRHERIKDAGASWDHPEYQPHLTISYDRDSPDLEGVEPYQGPIILGPEIFQEVNEDWVERIEEV